MRFLLSGESPFHSEIAHKHKYQKTMINLLLEQKTETEMSLFLLPDVFVFSGKGSGCDKDKPTLNRHTNILNRFLSAKNHCF